MDREITVNILGRLFEAIAVSNGKLLGKLGESILNLSQTTPMDLECFLFQLVDRFTYCNNPQKDSICQDPNQHKIIDWCTNALKRLIFVTERSKARYKCLDC